MNALFTILTILILLAAVLCLLVPLGALAGVKAVDTEENGKLKQTEWCV